MLALQTPAFVLVFNGFWDEHSLGIPRFYNALRLVYGSDPEDNADLELDEARPEQCPYEYERPFES